MKYMDLAAAPVEPLVSNVVVLAVVQNFPVMLNCSKKSNPVLNFSLMLKKSNPLLESCNQDPKIDWDESSYLQRSQSQGTQRREGSE
jgi:hypothetical protein